MAVGGDLVANLLLNSKQFGVGLSASRKDLGSFVAGARRAILPLTGLLAGALGSRESVRAALVQTKSEMKLAAVLKATGGAAQLSAQQIAEFASQRQAITNFGDETTLAGAAVLATFKEIKGPIFTEAITLAQDMSAVMEQDVKGSVIQLGKALNDPIRGVSALAEVGVSFTQQQKEQIKTLQESGDILGAQKVILQELTSEFGGAAEATADPLTQMTNMVGDLGENIGFILLPSIRELNAGLQDGLGPLAANSSLFKEMGEWIAGGVKFAVMYGKHIVGVAVALGTIVVVFNAVRIAQDLATKSMILFQSFSGPKGWAILAVGAAAYSTTLLALSDDFETAARRGKEVSTSVQSIGENNQAIRATKSEIENLTGSVTALAGAGTNVDAFFAKFETGAQKLQREIAEIRKLSEDGLLSPDQAADFESQTINSNTGIVDRIRSIKDEIAILRGETDQTGVELARLYEQGAPLQLITDLKESIRLRDQLKADREAAEETKKNQQQAQADKQNQKGGFFEALEKAPERAKELRESLLTDSEKLKRDLEEYQFLLGSGNLQQKEYDQLVARRQGEFDKSQDSGVDAPTGRNTALDANSSDAIAQITRQMIGAGTVSVQQKSLQSQQRIEALQRRATELLARLEQQGVKNSGKGPKQYKLS